VGRLQWRRTRVTFPTSRFQESLGKLTYSHKKARKIHAMEETNLIRPLLGNPMARWKFMVDGGGGGRRSLTFSFSFSQKKPMMRTTQIGAIHRLSALLVSREMKCCIKFTKNISVV